MSARLSSCLIATSLLFSQVSVAQNTLTVAAAADLTNLQAPLTRAAGKNEPKLRLRFVIGASALLAQQIENGAPYDVFLSANAQFVDRLASSGKLRPASIRPYARGRVAILWKDGKHHQLSDLAADWVRFVALPNPKLAPYGVAAQQALEHAGLWQRVQPKVVYGANVRQTLQLFESGNTDAVLTSDSLLVDRHPDLIPADWHQPIVQKLGIVADSSNGAAAQRFVDFLLSPAGQEVFARFGFAKP